jgi:hypothetical protein
VVKKFNRLLVFRRHGITAADYARLLAEQGGVCAICGKKPGRRSLAIDHEHGNGRIRGLLCDSCNIAIGMLKDDPHILENAIRYLRRPL